VAATSVGVGAIIAGISVGITVGGATVGSSLTSRVVVTASDGALQATNNHTKRQRIRKRFMQVSHFTEKDKPQANSLVVLSFYAYSIKLE
jgi:hypothetical protein